MKCMCPNCGSIIEQGQLSFDFTDYIMRKLTEQMMYVDDEDVTDGKDILLNAWKSVSPVLISEETLWNYPPADNISDNPKEKCVNFAIPVDILLSKPHDLEAFDDDDKDKVDQFIEWLEIHKDDVEGQVYPIRLVITGDGDIKFDRIPGVAEIRKCPHCHSEMSYWAGRYKEWTLTVLGGPRVSKSTAVTSCVASFMSGRDRVVSFEGTEKDKGYKLFKEECLDKYEAGMDLGATDVNADNIPRVSFRVSIGENKKRHICLTFVDVPGEFNNEKGIDARLDDRYNKIFNNIDFVWYCTDPGEVQQLQHNDIVRNDLGYVDKEVMDTSKIQDNMRTLSSYFSHSQRKVPVAYIMGKTDTKAISEKDRSEYGLYRRDQSEISLPFNVKSFFRRSEKVKRYIASKNGGLISEFEEMFPERCYIATSAYGYNPKDNNDGRLVKRPYNCKEAFYWMLAIRNCVDVCVETTKKRFGKTRTEEKTGKLAEFSPELREKTYRNLYMTGSYTN